MLIKIINDTILESNLDFLKSHFDVGSASKAVALGASIHQSNNETISEQSKRIEELEYRLETIVELLTNKKQVEQDINDFLAD